VDCFFETSSGFTTTGASILTHIEDLPKGILFWRSFTHWVGGMGVILLTLAILPSAGAGAVQIARPILPFALAFAAGAMLFVISDEIIPETHKRETYRTATYGIMIGFVVMMLFDVLLG
jgi:zinc transporter ZupT